MTGVRRAAGLLIEEADAIDRGIRCTPALMCSESRCCWPPGEAGGPGRRAGRASIQTATGEGEGRAISMAELPRRAVLSTASAVTRTRLPVAQRACEHEDFGIVQLAADRARRGSRPRRAARCRRRPPPACSRTRAARSGRPTGARYPGPVARARRRRRGCGRPVPRGDRAARAQPYRRASAPAPSSCTASGSVARTAGWTRVSNCVRAHACLGRIGRRGIRRARASRAARDR